MSANTLVPSASDPQQLNRYAYALNSPLNYTDPSGHAADAGGALCGSACWRAAYNNYLKYEQLYEGAGDAYHGSLKNYYNHVAQQYYNYATREPAQSIAFQDSQVAAAYSQLLTNGLNGPETAASAAWDGAAGFGFSTMFAGLASLGGPAISAEKVPTGERLEYTAKSPGDSVRVSSASQLDPSYTWGRPETLQDHFNRHGGPLGAKIPTEYAKMAADFLVRAVNESLPLKVDANGIIRAYDPATNTFGAYNPNGTTRTFFQPSSPTYWSRQPGTSPWLP